MIKDETKQISGAFKYRGSFHKLGRCAAGRQLVTASTGNHAAGLAHAAAAVRWPLVVFLPDTTPAKKIANARNCGATILLRQGGYDACEVEARAYAAAVGATYVHSFDDEEIIAGHRTLFREIETAWGRPDTAYVPVGGGGLVSAAIMEWGARPVRLVGVEHADAPAMQRSLRAGRRVTLGRASGFAEGLMVRTVGRVTFGVCADYGLPVETVTDGELRRAMRILHDEAGIRVEGAGAAALAAALREPDPKRSALCVASGGNVSQRAWDDFTHEP
jgi:threonine dehydratase